MLDRTQYCASDEARSAGEHAIRTLYENRGKHFGNARLVRNLFEHVQQEQANRLASISEPTREQLVAIEATDIEAAFAAVLPRPFEEDTKKD